MADMTVVCLWLPSGELDVDAGLAEIDRLGDDGLLAALPLGPSDPDEAPEQYVSGWEWDLIDDAGDEGAEKDEDAVAPPSQVARRFVAALAEGVRRSTRNVSVARFEPGAGGGVIVAVGGDWNSSVTSPQFLATFICAVEVFPTVAAAMGCVPPDRWRVDQIPASSQ